MLKLNDRELVLFLFFFFFFFVCVCVCVLLLLLLLLFNIILGELYLTGPKGNFKRRCQKMGPNFDGPGNCFIILGAG